MRPQSRRWMRARARARSLRNRCRRAPRPRQPRPTVLRLKKRSLSQRLSHIGVSGTASASSFLDLRKAAMPSSKLQAAMRPRHPLHCTCPLGLVCWHRLPRKDAVRSSPRGLLSACPPFTSRRSVRFASRQRLTTHSLSGWPPPDLWKRPRRTTRLPPPLSACVYLPPMPSVVDGFSMARLPQESLRRRSRTWACGHIAFSFWRAQAKTHVLLGRIVSSPSTYPQRQTSGLSSMPWSAPCVHSSYCARVTRRP
mmetsp:Transcript_26666/g.80847  ORF Transcript_26666/g.80847 Transcript_26666/m.80847 type:complete len:253 (+) Transcript_26666:619-1377(+)